MRRFLTVLTRSSLTGLQAYGVVVLSLGAITAFRLVVPLDKAPFLLYLPAVFLLSVAFGQRAGLLATAVSAVFAGSFFEHPGSWWQLTGPQWIAIGEYLAVGTAMALADPAGAADAAIVGVAVAAADIAVVTAEAGAGWTTSAAGDAAAADTSAAWSGVTGVTGVAGQAPLVEPAPGVEEADFFWPSAGAVRAT